MENLRKLTPGKAKEYVLRYVKRYEVDRLFRDEFIEELLRYHPDKQKRERLKKLEYLIPRKTVFGNVIIKYKSENYNEDDISLFKCIEMYYGIYDVYMDERKFIKRAFRDSIRKTRYAEYYESNMNKSCELCGKKFSRMNRASVDHKKGFMEILNEYLEERNINIMNVAVRNKEDSVEMEIIDPVLREDWISYHDSVATFGILCIKCNKDKNKNTEY